MSSSYEKLQEELRKSPLGRYGIVCEPGAAFITPANGRPPWAALDGPRPTIRALPDKPRRGRQGRRMTVDNSHIGEIEDPPPYSKHICDSFDENPDKDPPEYSENICGIETYNKPWCCMTMMSLLWMLSILSCIALRDLVIFWS